MSKTRDVGNLGEKAFHMLCAECGIVASPPDQDRHGWDFFAELPITNDRTEPADKQSSTIRCLIQIKSSDKPLRRLPIKLSALKQLVDAELPAFLVFFMFGGQAKPRQMIVMHIGREIMADTLRRLRKATLDGQQFHLHKIEVQVPLSKGDQITVSGDELLGALRSYIPSGSLEQYLAAKNHDNRWLGYESLPLTFTVTPKKHPYVELIEHDLGLTEHICVPSMVIRDRRFDMEIKKPLISLSECKLTLHSHKAVVNECAAITFGQDPHDLALTFPATVRTSDLNSLVPLHERCFRVSGDWFDIVITPFSTACRQRLVDGEIVFSGEGTIKFHSLLEPSKILLLPLLRRALQAVEGIVTSSQSLLIIWFDKNKTQAISAILSGQEGLVSVDYVLNIITSVVRILNEHSVDPNMLEVSLAQMEDQRDSLEYIVAAHNRTWVDARLSGTLSTAIRSSAGPATVSSGYHDTVSSLEFGVWTLVLLTRFTLDDILIDYEAASISARIANSEVMRVIVVPAAAVEAGEWCRKLKQGVSRLSSDLRILALGPGFSDSLAERIRTVLNEP